MLERHTEGVDEKSNDGQGREDLPQYLDRGEKEPVTFDNRTYTHYVSCAPRKEERKEGVYYGIGDLMESTFKSNIPSPEDINNAPSVDDSDLPF